LLGDVAGCRTVDDAKDRLRDEYELAVAAVEDNLVGR